MHGQVGDALRQNTLRVPEREPERELRPAVQDLESLLEGAEVGALLAREIRLLEHDEIGVDRVELRLQNAFGHRLGRDIRSVRESERRRQRHETRRRAAGAMYRSSSGARSFGSAVVALGAL